MSEPALAPAEGTPSAAPEPTPAENPTIAGGGTGPEVTAPQDWPDNWRNLLAGEDEKSLKQLERYQSPNDVWKKTRNLEVEFSKRKPRLEFDPEMPAEKLAQWREQEGIPESADKYKLEYDDGLTIGEDDKAEVDEYLKYAHEKNIPESHVKESVRWLFDAIDDQGMRLGDNEHIVKWAVDVIKKLNPAATFTLPGGESGIQAGENRLKELKTVMTTDYRRWMQSPDLQKEYDDLVSRMSAVKPR
ncbi:MAG: hypothetical protein P8Y45_24070 [Exilibacterium sp.]